MMVKSVLLPLAPIAAFQLFTQKIGEWWPPDRRHTEDPASEIFLLESGRFFERAATGARWSLAPFDPGTCRTESFSIFLSRPVRKSRQRSKLPSPPAVTARR
jgi:hypothetical protein